MAQLNYEIPDELHRRLKIVAAETETTLKDLVIWYLSAPVGLASVPMIQQRTWDKQNV